MKKTCIKIMLVMLVMPFTLKAQLSPKVRQQYKPITALKVFELAKKIKLPEDTQLALANYYKNQDSLGNIAFLKGESMETVSAFYKLKPNTILSKEVMNDYFLATTGSNRKLRYAIKYRKDLKLSDEQLQTLLQALEDASIKKKDENFNEGKFDAEQLDKVLSLKQYNQLLTLYYDNKAKDFAYEIYRRVRKYNLIAVADSVKKIEEFYQYELKKRIKTDLVTQSGNQKKIDSVKKVININKPEILWKENALANRLAHTKFTELINYRDQLNLTEAQVDTLVNKIIQLEKTKFYERVNNPYSKYTGKAFEKENVLKTLTKPQLEQYFELRNQKRAIYNTQQNWQRLKALGLVTNADSLKINKENQAYELKYLTASEILSMEKSQKNAFNRQAIQNAKPVLLKQLDAIDTDKAVKANTKKQLTW